MIRHRPRIRRWLSITTTVVASVLALAAWASQERITIFMIGDSTMADRVDLASTPERGWGQMLPRFFDEHVLVRNFAVNGRSTRTFIDEGRWDVVLQQVAPGDYVVIQFAHNDQNSRDPLRHANAHTAYRRNLERFVAETRARGGIPVLFTPLSRRSYNENGVLMDSHGEYPGVVRAVAREMDVAFVDLLTSTEDMVLRYGFGPSKSLFIHLGPGEHARFPEGREDNTHLSDKGAREVARLAAEGMRDARLPVTRYLRADSVAIERW